MKKATLAVLLIFFTSISFTSMAAPASSIIRNAFSSYYAVWADTGEPIDGFHETAPLNPASTTKLITAYCALKELGGDYRFKTLFFSDGPIQNGVIHNLWIRGEGDPSMVNESLLGIVDALKNLGLRKITGDVIVDDSFFDAGDYPGRKSNNEKAYNALTSATSLNFNSLEVQVQSNGRVPIVTLIPDTPYFHLVNKLQTGGRSAYVVIKSENNGNFETIRVTGRIPSRMGPMSFYRTVQKPAKFFGEALVASLKNNDVNIHGETRIGIVSPSSQMFFIWESKPLDLILQDMNKFSNNFIAEQITKYLGVKKLGPPGTTEKGTTVFKNCLNDSGIATANLDIENGSGLTYNNKVSAEQLVQVLTAAFASPKMREDYISSLSVYGQDGTMRRRHSPQLEGMLVGKTGSLNGISTLAGFVPAADGNAIAFAILMNNYKWGRSNPHQLQDALVTKWMKSRRGKR
ncbi:MAG: D-alanyl-D-alanine carboxypeptidase/D-alanyl-D-alanine-endopeptidase [Deltaproteobacteria bacterium]|nr:D-alanyl-D-alanine carboxypeptidase/D-alanyl-D-alanine-endopeptidase [Deltaproteobacteria bacterium]